LLSLKAMSFYQRISPLDSLPSTKKHLASLALDAIMDSRNSIDKNQTEKRWYNLTFDGMVKFVLEDHILVQHGAIVRVNPEKYNALDIIKKLNDAGLVESYHFNEVQASKNCPEKISLTVSVASEESEGQLSTSSVSKLGLTRSGTLSFSRSRTTESKKWIRQHLVSLALDSMIAVKMSKKGGRKLYWYNLSLEDFKDRIKHRKGCNSRRGRRGR